MRLPGERAWDNDQEPRKEWLDRQCRELKTLGPKNLLETVAKIDWKSIRKREAKAFIDWDDCIMGDSMDDLSLMGVTGDDAVTRMILESYAEVRPLASDAAERFWLCWLRNMVFKAVIRLKAGYFAKEGDDFFLVARGGDGSSLARLTHEKIDQALCALEKDKGFDGLRLQEAITSET